MASGGFLTVETLKFSQATASYVAGIPSGETCYDLQMNYEDTLGKTRNATASDGAHSADKKDTDSSGD